MTERGRRSQIYDLRRLSTIADRAWHVASSTFNSDNSKGQAWICCILTGLSAIGCCWIWLAYRCAPTLSQSNVILGILICASVGFGLTFRKNSAAKLDSARLVSGCVILFAVGAICHSLIDPFRDLHASPESPRTQIRSSVASFSWPEATIELVAVAVDWYGSMSPLWWRPDGTPINTRSWSIDPDYIPHLVDGEQQRVFVIHVQSKSHQPRMIDCEFDGDSAAERQFSVAGPQGHSAEWIGLSKKLKRQQRTTRLRLWIAAGPYFSIPSLDKQDQFTQFGINLSEISCSGVQDHEGHAAIVVSGFRESTVRSVEFRIRAVNQSGQWHECLGSPAPSHSDAFSSRIFEFMELKSSEVAQFVLECRPIYCVEFQNIALSADQGTSVTAVNILDLP